MIPLYATVFQKPMTDIPTLLQSILPGVISGGGAALSAVYSFIQSTKKEILEIKNRIGSLDTRTGIVYDLNNLTLSVSQLKDQVQVALKQINDLTTRDSDLGVERWSKHPALATHTTDSFNGEVILQKVTFIENKVRDLEERAERVESKTRKFVTEDDFDQADRQRAEEIATVRTALAEVKGLLMGLQQALQMISRMGSPSNHTV